MCGITGIFNIKSGYKIEKDIVKAMADAIQHRGPDEEACVVEDNIGLGFRRLSIIDIAHGQQPFYSEDGSVMLICNGEIYNHKELRSELIAKGYRCKTQCDVEVIVHLYVAYGKGLLDRLNGQFAFALFDKKNSSLLLARDHFGICPLFYTLVNGQLIFGSEIKAILQHPHVKKETNITGLDQVFSFPGMVSPETMFKNIHSLKPGHFLSVEQSQLHIKEYWDLDYPTEDHAYDHHSESFYVEQLDELLTQSVKYRLNADVPVGFYLSGGLDSSLIGGLIQKINGNSPCQSFSIGFPGTADQEHDERVYQRMMSRFLNSHHIEIAFDWADVDKRLKQAVYYAESPLKETYNTCSLALSEAVHQHQTKVVLSGEGSDELLGGYVGYRFDAQRPHFQKEKALEDYYEDQIRQTLWGDPDFFYEKNQYELKETKKAIYSDSLNEVYDTFDCLQRLEIHKTKLKNRHRFHQRAYLDLKLRLSDHLIADHCDRVTYANSVEGRYPFLDIDVVEFIKLIPPDLKLKGLVEKYILKQVARKYVPKEIVQRQKFSFVAPDSPQLLRNEVAWVNDLLSYERVKRQGYFNPDTIEHLKKIYKNEHFTLNLPFDDDLLIIVLTFNIFLEVFQMPNI